MTEPPKFGERRDGWYQYELYLVCHPRGSDEGFPHYRDAVHRSLEKPRHFGITLTNPYSNKKFTVYHFDQLTLNIYRVKP